MKFISIIKHKLFGRIYTQKSKDLSEEFQISINPNENNFADGVFLNSLDEFSENDIQLNQTAASARKISVSELIKKILFFFFLAMFITSSILLVQNLIAKQRGSDIYNKLEEEFFSSGFSMEAADALLKDEGAVKTLVHDVELKSSKSMSDAEKDMDNEIFGSPKEYNEELEKMRAGLTSLAQINSDIYGWISVSGTDINYPLVQGEDNEYYLNHAYTGDFLPVGSIYVDYRCNETIMKNFNTVLYGHNIENMSGRSMFHDITKFFDDEYFYETYIYIYTFDGIYVYEPFAIYETRYDYNYFKTGFTSEEDFVSFAEEMHSNSSKDKDMEFSEDDRMITLSTCTNGAFYARYALHAKLVKVIEE